MNTNYTSPVRVLLEFDTYRQLETYLDDVRYSGSLDSVVGLAVREWLANTRRRAAEAPSTRVRGYLWKNLFLPEGTRLRTDVGGTAYYAVVEGDRLRTGDREVSPHQFANGCGNAGRNAWKTVHLLLPYETTWRLAAACRPRR